MSSFAAMRPHGGVMNHGGDSSQSSSQAPLHLSTVSWTAFLFFCGISGSPGAAPTIGRVATLNIRNAISIRLVFMVFFLCIVCCLLFVLCLYRLKIFSLHTAPIRPSRESLGSHGGRWPWWVMFVVITQSSSFWYCSVFLSLGVVW